MSVRDVSPETQLFWIITAVGAPVPIIALRYAYFLAAELGLGVDAGDVSFQGADRTLFLSAFEATLDILIQVRVARMVWKGNEECVELCGTLREEVVTSERYQRFWSWAAAQDVAMLLLIGRYVFHERYCQLHCTCIASFLRGDSAAGWYALHRLFGPLAEARTLAS